MPSDRELEKIEYDPSMPPELWAKIERIREKGGFQTLDQQLEFIKTIVDLINSGKIVGEDADLLRDAIDALREKCERIEDEDDT